jgi:hypothetical protein
VNTLSVDDALAHAGRWAARRRPPLEIDGEGDAFYGYYTFHTLRDGEIEGMVSVHGSSGRVWYHSWHGDFVGMAEDDH